MGEKRVQHDWDLDVYKLSVDAAMRILSEAEAGETQVWIEYSVKCGYWDRSVATEMNQLYDHIIRKLLTMENNPHPWIMK